MPRRFGVAILAGLAIGVLIFGTASLYPVSQLSGAANFEILQTTLNTSTRSATTATAGVPAYGYNTTTPATSSTTSGPGSGTTAWIPSNAPQAYLASHITNLPRQSPSISIAVLLPVLAAICFGLIIYRISVPSDSELPEEKNGKRDTSRPYS